MSAWTTQPPTEPGFYWARAAFLGLEPGAIEPVRVVLNARFGITWQEFVKEQAQRAPSDQLPVEWVFEVHILGSQVPYTIGDIDAWGPRIHADLVLSEGLARL